MLFTLQFSADNGWFFGMPMDNFTRDIQNHYAYMISKLDTLFSQFK
jgi:hypothetical protein